MCQSTILRVLILCGQSKPFLWVTHTHTHTVTHTHTHTQSREVESLFWELTLDYLVSSLVSMVYTPYNSQSCDCHVTTAETEEGRPPIKVKFEIPYFTTSGIQVIKTSLETTMFKMVNFIGTVLKNYWKEWVSGVAMGTLHHTERRYVDTHPTPHTSSLHTHSHRLSTKNQLNQLLFRLVLFLVLCVKYILSVLFLIAFVGL